MRSFIKKLFRISIVTNLLVQTLSAQSPGYHIRGKVIDGKKDKPLEAVTVQLSQRKFDSSSILITVSILGGIVNDKKGEFYFEIPSDCASVRLELTTIGYKKVDTVIIFPAAIQGLLTPSNEYYCSMNMKVDTTVLDRATVTST